MKTDHMAPSSSADGVVWDLRPLYAATDDEQLGKDLALALDRAVTFETRYRGKVADLDAVGLRDALIELQNLRELTDTPAIYAHLLHAGKTDEAEHGRLVALTQEQATAINRHLIFFDLEWVQVDDGQAETLLQDSRLKDFAYLLELERRYKPHRLPEGEEQLLDEKANTGSRAWGRLFEEVTSRLTADVTVDGQMKTLGQAETLALSYHPDRTTRKSAADGMTTTLETNLHALGYIFNVRLQDHATDDRIRSYPSPMTARCLSNQIEQSSVDALVEACVSGFPIVARYYRLKQKLLGLSELFDYDRYAPLSSDLPSYNWATAQDIVLESYNEFSSTLGDIARRAFAERWIDAELRPGKRGGAFSMGGTTTTHPYILANYTDTVRDVMTVAHEMGHTVHQFLSYGVGYLQAHTPLTTAETASVFGEMIVFRRLLDAQTSDRAKLGLLASKIEDHFATVFRQIAMHNFEYRAHVARRKEGELSTDRLSELWFEANSEMFGDSVILRDDYRVWWSYIPHFIRTPFYVHAYAFGDLLVLGLVQRYQEQGDAFVPRYVEMLTKGGSVSPIALMEPLGINLGDPAFWSQGVNVLDELVSEAEILAEAIA
jgi:oligoendopeptidase F